MGTRWEKWPGNPVLGSELGTCFDICVVKEGDRFRMWFSWRPRASIGLVESDDGVHWGEPRIVLAPNPKTEWEQHVNRISVVPRPGGYHMWYTGQRWEPERSAIGHAWSPDGIAWARSRVSPVLVPEAPWEGCALMCPHVLWDEEAALYRMWYSGGEQYEPDAIGYATSPDGIHWVKWRGNPVFTKDATHAWEQHKVAACHVVVHGDWHYLFHIGFRDVDHAQIGLARSRDGITNWERHPANPIISPTPDAWDRDACYKPFALFDDERKLWRLWYNGRREHVEQIGLALHEGEELWP